MLNTVKRYRIVVPTFVYTEGVHDKHCNENKRQVANSDVFIITIPSTLAATNSNHMITELGASWENSGILPGYLLQACM